MKRALLVLLMIVALVPTVASAQDTPTIGLTTGYPAGVGVHWNVTDRVALRPEFTWSKSSSDYPAITDPILGTIGNATSTASWQAGVGVGALFFVSRHDNLRTYLSPRVGYSRSSQTSGANSSLASSEGFTRSWSTAGSFGAQYALGSHFGVFGELGMSYTAATTQITLVETRTTLGPIIGPNGQISLTTSTSTFTVRSESSNKSVGIRNAIGVIIYF